MFFTDKASEREDWRCVSRVVREFAECLQRPSDGLSGERRRERNETPDRAKRDLASTSITREKILKTRSPLVDVCVRILRNRTLHTV